LNTRTVKLALSCFVIFQSLLIFAPLFILGAAIDWPNSLDFPPSQILPLIAKNLDQFRLGYGIYLIYSLLWIVVGAAIPWLACRKEGGVSILVMLAVTLGCISAVARSIGIIRWLTASSEFSRVYQNSGEVAVKSGIEAAQIAVNSWGGAIGEVLGVALFAAAWLIAVSMIIVTNKSLPKILGILGFPVAIIVALPSAELFGFQLMSVTASTSAMHFWLLTVGTTTYVSIIRNP
jgi:hypothetical protein